MNRGQLLACIPKDRVRTLSNPPPLPPQGKIGFTLPSSIDIVRLLPQREGESNEEHMLVSAQYAINVFNRVEKYFRLFYAPYSSEATVSLDAVDVIFNSALESQFGAANAAFERNFKGISEMEV